MQLDATEEEMEKCERIKRDASMKLLEISKGVCERKVCELEIYVQSIYTLVSDSDIEEAELWADELNLRLETTKNKKWSVLSSKFERSQRVENFGIINVARDGNCFYRCLSQHLYGTQMYHNSLREDLVQYMLSNMDAYQHLIDGDAERHLREQLYTDGRISSWATEAEIKGAADRYHLRILVSLTKACSEFQTFADAKSESIQECDKLHLLLENHHFSMLKVPVAELYNAANATSITDWFEPELQLCKAGSPKQHEIRSKVITEAQQCTGRCGREQNCGRNLKKDRKENVDNKKNETNGHKAIVTNISSVELTVKQTQLLGKGLKFIPDRKSVDKVKLLTDLCAWERRMRLMEYFYDKEGETTQKEDKIHDKFRQKKVSTFTPNVGRDSNLDAYIDIVKDDIFSNLKRSGRLNLSKEESEAFHQLLHNESIVIRPADKGSGVVVMDKDKYVRSLQEEIENNNSYLTTDTETTKNVMKNVKKLVNKMHRNGNISGDLQQYLIPKYPQAGQLKGNPKLHKAGMPLRTIVSGLHTPTERLAELAEHELTDYVESTPSFVKDTNDFITKLRSIPEPLPEGCILFCFDVVKLYPSVPRREGLAACKEALEVRTNPVIKCADEVLEMIEIVLDNNNFQLGDKHYIQREGVAIGSRLGKNFACSYMRKWDESLMKATKIPLFYKRFIDDGFGIWAGTGEELLIFTEHANAIHPNIQVELRYSTSAIEFLDTLVKIDNGHVYTDLYVKETDKQMYLNQSSCHPPHLKRSLAYGLGLRIRRICEREQDYQRHRTKLKRQLRTRGYSGSFVEKQLQKVDRMDRNDILTGKSWRNRTQNRVPLVMTYSKLLPDIHQIVRKHLPILHRSGRMQEIFKEPPLVAFRRDTNLCDTLVHGKTNKAVRSYQSACSPSCKLCPKINRSEIKSTDRRHTAQVTSFTNCTVKNVVYAISCIKCMKVVYVGETERQLRERMSEHLRDVRLRKEKPITEHFDLGHDEDMIQFSVLQKLYKAGRTERIIRESTWIKRLRTARPDGCNVKETNLPAHLNKEKI